MATETWHRRLTISAKRGREGGASRLVDIADLSCQFVVPIDVHLRAGEKAIPVPITAAAVSPTEASWAVLGCSRKGVVARLAEQNTTRTCRASGWLCRTTDTLFSQVQDGTVTPAWSENSWINHETGTTALYFHLRAEQVDDYFFDEQVIETDSLLDTTSVAHYIFGDGEDGNYVDLGNENDGKIFQFYCKPLTILPGNAWMELHSHPYKSILHDDEVTPLGADSVTYVQNNPGSDFYVADFLTQLTLNQWSLVTLYKEDFAATGDPLWSRITSCRFHFFKPAHNTSKKTRYSSIYFGDPLDSHLNSAGVISRVMVDTKPAVLSLDAPPTTDADVKGIVVIG